MVSLGAKLNGWGGGGQSPHFPNSRYLYLAFELREAEMRIEQLGVYFKVLYAYVPTKLHINLLY